MNEHAKNYPITDLIQNYFDHKINQSKNKPFVNLHNSWKNSFPEPPKKLTESILLKYYILLTTHQPQFLSPKSKFTTVFLMEYANRTNSESSSTRNQSTIGSETTVLLPRKKQKKYLCRWMKNKTKKFEFEKLEFEEGMLSDIGSTSSQGAGQVQLVSGKSQPLVKKLLQHFNRIGGKQSEVTKTTSLLRSNSLSISSALATGSKTTIENDELVVYSKIYEMCNPTTYIKTGAPPQLNISLADGLHEMVDMLRKLEENRNHLTATFTKYIKNDNFKNQLISLLTKYSKECRGTEEKLTNLARGTWKEMCEANDEIQKELKGHLSELVGRNRELQVEIDRLMKVVENISSSFDIKESIVRNNNILRNKILTLLNQSSNLENELQQLQLRNESMKKQFRSLQTEISNQKAVARKVETDLQIELISLSQKIKVADKLLEAGHEAGNLLLGAVGGGFEFSSSQLSLAELINACKNFALKKLKETHSQLAQKDNKIAALQADIEQFTKQIIEKDEELILTKETMCEHKSENDSLRMQLHGMKQLLSVSQSEDLAKELTDAQEKIAFFQSQYYQLMSERNQLLSQLQTFHLEREELAHNHTYHHQLISQNESLQKQLEEEKRNCFELQTERVRLREEKNVIRNVYSNIKDEIGKVQKLEENFVDANVEAKRLAMIVEFNKQVGERLESEIAEKDKKIFELETSLGKLNEANFENAKDKVALCIELNETSNQKDHLNNSLTEKSKKVLCLDESNNAIKGKLRALEEMQRIERAALKELLRDYKNVVAQRNELQGVKESFAQKVTELNQKLIDQDGSIKLLKEKNRQYKKDKQLELVNHNLQCQKLQSEVTSSIRRESECKAQLKQLQDKNHRLDEETSIMKLSLSDKTSETKNLQKILKTKDAEILERKEKFESLFNKTLEMEVALQEVRLQLQLLTTIEDKRKELEKEIEEQDKTIDSLEESNLSLKRDLSENCRNREKDLALLENRLANLTRVHSEQHENMEHDLNCLRNLLEREQTRFCISADFFRKLSAAVKSLVLEKNARERGDENSELELWETNEKIRALQGVKEQLEKANTEKEGFIITLQEQLNKKDLELTAFSKIKQDLVLVEFQKHEMCLRLHELEGKLRNELNLRTEADNLISRMLEKIVRLLKEQIISKEASDALMMIVKQ